jgi:hypothetical protein
VRIGSQWAGSREIRSRRRKQAARLKFVDEDPEVRLVGSCLWQALLKEIEKRQIVVDAGRMDLRIFLRARDRFEDFEM